MKVLNAIGNYIIWWVTTILGIIALILFGIIYFFGGAFYLLGAMLWRCITAPIDNDYTIWAKGKFVAIWHFMGSKPLKRGDIEK